MKAIILGAGQNSSKEKKPPTAIIKDKTGRKTLDWILNGFKYSNINDVVFIGGYEIDEIVKNYPSLRYYHNQNWQKKGMLQSLFCAEKELEGNFVLSYSDIVFKPSIIKKLLESNNLITLVVDVNWKSRYFGESGHELLKAEKVCSDKTKITKISKDIPLSENIFGEFIGLAYFSKEGAKILKDAYKQTSPTVQGGHLIDILQEIIDRKVPINFITTEGEWATLDSPKDMDQFIFGTKGETLERLQDLLKKGKICSQIRFEVKEWLKDKEYWTKTIRKYFDNRKIVIRSSAISEDSASNSMAGAFKSINEIDSKNSSAIVEGVKKVIDSYGKENYFENQVLIQEQIENVKMSGVIFTRNLETGAPYYTITYDNNSSRTDTITGGITQSDNTLYIHRALDPKDLPDQNFRRLVEICKKLERLTTSEKLDIEFAVTNNNDIFIFQVRPITSIKDLNRDLEAELNQEIKSIEIYINSKQGEFPHIFGKTTYFGDMPDWNPAEIIGTRPKPLALSLYQYILLNNVWREAKAKIGYFNPYPEALLISLGGKPYIDIRVSFNSFLPKSLPENISEKLMNYYLAELHANPKLHDKVEFEILLTNIGVDYDKHEIKLRKKGFTEKELEIIKKSLLELTENIISQITAPINDELGSIDQLEKRRKKVLANNKLQKLQKAKILLDDCMEFGTRPFTILARYAFIGTSFLKGLLSKNLITRVEHDDFLQSIESITSKIIEDFDKLQSKQLTIKQFLKKYGHLRPGTYDLLCPRYDENPEIYLNQKYEPAELKTQKRKITKIEKNRIIKIDETLREIGFTFDSDTLLEFIKNSLVAREQAKFEFSKNLSEALKLIQKFGEELDLPKEAIVFLSIDEIFEFINKNEPHDLKMHLLEKIKKSKDRYAITQLLKLPQLITAADDIRIINDNANKPNFVTQKKITEEIILLNKLNEKTDLENKIVLIENADPGFDWIFSKRIKGLITKYGGVGSHMAIRCAELGLPAAIGCGENLFERLRTHRSLELNCENETIKTI